MQKMAEGEGGIGVKCVGEWGVRKLFHIHEPACSSLWLDEYVAVGNCWKGRVRTPVA